MNERLNQDGNWPTAIEDKRIMFGAKSSATFFRTEVGIGSAAEDVYGSRWISELTSSAVVSRKLESDDDDVMIVGEFGDESSVAWQTASTLLAKKVVAVLIGRDASTGCQTATATAKKTVDRPPQPHWIQPFWLYTQIPEIRCLSMPQLAVDSSLVCSCSSGPTYDRLVGRAVKSRWRSEEQPCRDASMVWRRQQRGTVENGRVELTSRASGGRTGQRQPAKRRRVVGAQRRPTRHQDSTSKPYCGICKILYRTDSAVFVAIPYWTLKVNATNLLSKRFYMHHEARMVFFGGQSD